MHGVVMSGLRDFIVEQEGRRTWMEIKDRAEIDRATYSRTEDYPDGEFKQLYEVLVAEYGMNGDRLQRRFGQFVFGELAELYERIYFDDDWGPLDMIDNVEETIHQSLKRRRGVAFTPPELETHRNGDAEVVVEYTSDRQLCEFAKGMINGVGSYYGTHLEIDEPVCMKDGNERCRIVVTDTTASSA